MELEDDATEAIREGVADLAAGRIRPWEEFLQELCERYGLRIERERIDFREQQIDG